ncbi:hypothetical protein ACFE04_027698 [Oxalis oulophora]
MNYKKSSLGQNPSQRATVTDRRLSTSSSSTAAPPLQPSTPNSATRRQQQTPSRSKPSPSRSTKKPPPDSPTVADDPSLDNPDLGPFLLKLARDTIASGDGPAKALDYAIRASKSFERCAATAAAIYSLPIMR